MIPGFSSGIRYLALADGHVIPVRDFMTLYIYKEIFVDRCYDLTFDQSAPVIIDIGANSGLFALRIKQLYPSARISCYEPFPPNFAQLQNTIAINRLEAVTPLQKAVGARPGRAKLFIHKRNMGGHSFYVSETLNTDYVDVEVVDLPSILGELQQGVDLLKVDCEGAEFDILMGLTAADAGKIRQIIVETTSGLYDVDQLNEQMTSLGYQHQSRDGLCLYTRDPQPGIRVPAPVVAPRRVVRGETGLACRQSAGSRLATPCFWEPDRGGMHGSRAHLLRRRQHSCRQQQLAAIADI
jgi:FkbM family methyltransferase